MKGATQQNLTFKRMRIPLETQNATQLTPQEIEVFSSSHRTVIKLCMSIYAFIILLVKLKGQQRKSIVHEK